MSTVVQRSNRPPRGKGPVWTTCPVGVVVPEMWLCTEGPAVVSLALGLNVWQHEWLDGPWRVDPTVWLPRLPRSCPPPPASTGALVRRVLGPSASSFGLLGGWAPPPQWMLSGGHEHAFEDHTPHAHSTDPPGVSTLSLTWLFLLGP